METKFCTKCGAKIGADSRFCNKCGAQQIEVVQSYVEQQYSTGRQSAQNPVRKKKNGVVIAVLCAMLGIIVVISIGVVAITHVGNNSNDYLIGQSSDSCSDRDYSATVSSDSGTGSNVAAGNNSGTDFNATAGSNSGTDSNDIAGSNNGTGSNDTYSDDSIGEDTSIENVTQSVPTVDIPAEWACIVTDKNGNEQSMIAFELLHTGDEEINLFHVETLIGEDNVAFTDARVLIFSAYVPVAECYEGLIYDGGDFDSKGLLRVVSYNVYDLYNNPFFNEEDIIYDQYTANTEFILSQYSPARSAVFSLKTDVTIDGTTYTIEVSGYTDYLVNKKEACEVCDGTGVCRICHGTGEGAGFYEYCVSCGGNKRCKYCDGTGEVDVLRRNY